MSQVSSGTTPRVLWKHHGFIACETAQCAVIDIGVGTNVGEPREPSVSRDSTPDGPLGMRRVQVRSLERRSRPAQSRPHFFHVEPRTLRRGMTLVFQCKLPLCSSSVAKTPTHNHLLIAPRTRPAGAAGEQSTRVKTRLSFRTPTRTFHVKPASSWPDHRVFPLLLQHQIGSSP